MFFLLVFFILSEANASVKGCFLGNSGREKTRLRPEQEEEWAGEHSRTNRTNSLSSLIKNKRRTIGRTMGYGFGGLDTEIWRWKGSPHAIINQKPQCFPLFRVLHSGILVHYNVLESPSLSVIVPGSSLDCESLIDFLDYEVT